MMESHYKGRPLSELTREELIEAVEKMAEMYYQQVDQHERDLKNAIWRS